MKDELKRILEEARRELSQAADPRFLEELKTKYLGKKGVIRDVLGKLGSMSEDVRREMGRVANEVKDEITAMLDSAAAAIESAAEEASLRVGVDDVSVNREPLPQGFYHPITLMVDKMTRVFKSMGYTVVDGPELEEEYYNFDALNIPPHHPARDDHDSFYIEKGRLMRTHTSPVQVRTMQSRKPPIAVVVPGRCYRRDAVDATHAHTFHQMEGLVVDEGISFADLKGTLLLFAKLMFGEKTRIRLRPDFFPFTEPSAELGVSCPVCGGSGCTVCKHTGWIEIGGCGLVDPEVFKNVGYDTEKVTGFAFGVGVERIAMRVFGIKDIRQFHENDLRLLEQFIK